MAAAAAPLSPLAEGGGGEDSHGDGQVGVVPDVSAVAPSFRIARTTTLVGATSASSELGVGVHGGAVPLSGVGGAPAVLAGSGGGSDGSGGGAVAGVRVPSHRLVGGGGAGGTSFLDRYRSQYRSTGL